MKLTFSANIEVFDKDKYMEAVRAEFKRVFIKAGQRFLLIVIPKIPIWTGMLRGVFRNLEDIVGKVTADSQSGGYRIRGTRGGGNSNISSKNNYYYYPPDGGKVLRTPEAGRQFSTSPDKIIDLEGGSLASGKTAMYFKFDVNLTYFDTIDQKLGIMKAGADALGEYIKENVKLPNPLEFITRKIIRKSS